jgi:hypothetical protein
MRDERLIIDNAEGMLPSGKQGESMDMKREITRMREEGFQDETSTQVDDSDVDYSFESL